MTASDTGEKPIPIREDMKTPCAVMLLAFATLFVGVSDHGLWTPDEPREAELVRSMARPGASRLYPDLAGKPFVQKPPLFYWMAALSLRELGSLLGEVGATRAASAYCALLTALLIWAAARRFMGPAGGTASTAALLTTVGFFHAGHWIITDPALMLTVTAAVLLAFWGEEEDRPSLVLAAFACAGLSFLAKGLIGPALMVPPALAMTAIHRRTVSARRSLHLAGFVMAALVMLAWAVPFILNAPPEAWRTWFWDNQVGRFLGRTTELGHIRGPLYYVPILPLMLMPWTPVLIGAIWACRRQEWLLDGPARRLLLTAGAWAVGGMLLLTLAGTKRDIYLHPLLPAFALLIGTAAVAYQPRWVEIYLSVLGWLMASALLAAGFLQACWDGSGLEWGMRIQPWALAAFGMTFWLLLGSRMPSFPKAVGITAVFYLGIVKTLVPQVDRAKDYEPETRVILAALPAHAEEVTCAWDLDETSRGLLGYYGGLSLFDLHEEYANAERMAVLKDVLAGKRARCRFLVAMSKRYAFPPPGVDLDPEHVLATGKLGGGRTLYLIDCTRRDACKDHSVSNTGAIRNGE